IAVADPVLQRDAPAPAGWHGGSGGVRRNLVRDMRTGQRSRAVAGQPLRPILPLLAERAADQQRAKARAIDEQVSGDLLPAFEHQGGYVAAFRILAHLDYAPFDPLDADRLAVLAQERAEQR